MKSLLPWACLVITAVAPVTYANEGVDAYRQGDYAKAAALLTEESKTDAIVEYYKGRMRLYGYGLLKNNTVALDHLRQAGDKGSLTAQNILARYELLVKNDPKKAFHWFKKAADQDDTPAQMYVAAAYIFGYGVKESNMTARRYYIAAAKNGNPIAQFTLAEYFLSSRNAHNRKLGRIWLNKAVEQDNSKAILKQAEIYLEGKGVKKDTNKAKELINKAIKQGLTPAIYQMGELEQQEKNMKLAAEWYLKAAKKKYPPAQFALGKLFLNEDNAFSNPHTGFLWILKAAQSDYKKAQQEMAIMYEKGIGIPKNETLAKAWQKIASKKVKKPETKAKVEAAEWLSDGKATNFESSGYRLTGIFSPWHNKKALKENQYNQAPQMVKITRDSLYHPKFELADPNTIPISQYYNALVNTLGDLPNGTFIPPHYPLNKLRVYESKESLIPDSPIKRKNADNQHLLPELNKGGSFDLLAFMSDPDKKESAYSLYQKLFNRAILGNADAQFKMGQLYENGIAVNQDIPKAIEFYQLAADQNELRARYNLGLIYLEGKGVEPDYAKAESLLKEAAFRGNALAQYTMARLEEQGYRNPEGKMVIKPDNDESIAMYYIAAANGYGPAQYRLAEVLVREKPGDMSVATRKRRNQMVKKLYQNAVNNGMKQASLPLAFFNAMDKDKEKQKQAFFVAKEEAEKGDTQAALLLGLMKDRGIGTEKKPTDAIYWYQKTTANPVGAFILGTYLSEGKKINQNKRVGRQLLQKSADAGFSYGHLNLAIVKQQQGEDFLTELQDASTLGNSIAGLLLADYYLSLGNDADKMADARGIYQSFADKADKNAQLKLAFMHEKGLGGKVDYTSAEEGYIQAAKQGQPQAQYLLGQLYLRGLIGDEPDYKKAKKLMKQAMVNYSPAAVALGFIYDTVEDDYQRALAAYQAAAKQNNDIGQFNLGLMYELGKGVPVDFNKARTLYQQAAKKGHPGAMRQLAGIDFDAREKLQALNWYKKAAQLGDREALYQLGLMAETGVASDINPAEAINYYQQAADKGNVKALLALARMYQYGQGVQKDNKKAMEIYETLAHQNNPYAQFQLATLYYEGVDGKPEPKKGKELLQKAQKNGYKQAGKILQWLDTQSQQRVSYMEPIIINQSIKITGQPADLMYLEAMNEWNRGDEAMSRRILDRILKQFPHYVPAKRAYEQLYQSFSPKHFS